MEEKFEKRLFNILELLIDRVNRLKKLENGSWYYWTYYDMVLNQFRVMFIESPNLKKNYTAKNYMNGIGQNQVMVNNYPYKKIVST